MSITGLVIIYVILWWIIFFAILPIDVDRKKVAKIEGEILDHQKIQNDEKIHLLYRNNNYPFLDNLFINEI